MTTNFALSLSFEGIELLHRVPRGWRRVGRADVSSETLDADLAALRDKAMALDPDGLRTKLIIPRDQIKYTAIDSTQTTQDDIDAALDGATPYALDELAIDYERSGGRTHIAAVARETLREAEVFASGHGFRPVAFVAVAEPFTFQKEVFFGPTSMMQDILGAGAEVTRDLLPVMVVGTRLKSRLLVFDLPKEVEEDIYKDDLAALLSGQAVSEAEPPAPEPTAQISPATETQITIEEPDVTANVLPESDEPAAPAQPIWVDHVPAEYHKPSPPEDVAAVDILPAFTLIPASPNFAHPPLLDAIIAEFHPSQFRPTKPKLVAMKQAAPKLAASAPAANRATAPKVSAPSKTPLIAAAVAGAALIIGAVLWSQQQSSEVASAPDTAVAPLAEQTTRPLEITQAAPEPLEAGPVTALVELADFGAENTNGGALPE
ncbi:MAG: hypothetical protein NWP79_04450, partial [Paracoccaceae bacterium]|nr:hypothetical protein [Paracoccaceae bacterium]